MGSSNNSNIKNSNNHNYITLILILLVIVVQRLWISEILHREAAEDVGEQGEDDDFERDAAKIVCGLRSGLGLYIYIYIYTHIYIHTHI